MPCQLLLHPIAPLRFVAFPSRQKWKCWQESPCTLSWGSFAEALSGSDVKDWVLALNSQRITKGLQESKSLSGFHLAVWYLCSFLGFIASVHLVAQVRLRRWRQPVLRGMRGKDQKHLRAAGKLSSATVLGRVSTVVRRAEALSFTSQLQCIQSSLFVSFVNKLGINNGHTLRVMVSGFQCYVYKSFWLPRPFSLGWAPSIAVWHGISRNGVGSQWWNSCWRLGYLADPGSRGSPIWGGDVCTSSIWV